MLYNKCLLPAIFCLLVCATVSRAASKPSCSFEHFSTDDGLPQFSITNVIQDKKGFIWLASFDGLSRFDGCEFHNYKARPKNSLPMKSNRIVRIMEDCYGRIWMQLYSNDVHCFDPNTEQIWSLPQTLDSYNGHFTSTDMLMLPSGKVCILSDDNGCVCINDSLFSTYHFSVQNRNLTNNKVNTICEDSDLNIWILTDNGIMYIPHNKQDSIVPYFENRTGNSLFNRKFSAVTEIGDHVLFGANDGYIERYSKSERTFTTIKLPAPCDISNIKQIGKEEIFVSTISNGFFLINKKNEIYKAFNSKTIKGWCDGNTDVVYIHRNQVWFTSGNNIGIYMFNLNTEKISYFNTATSMGPIPLIPAPAFVIKDANDNLWIQPQGGGFSKYDSINNTLEPFYNKTDYPEKIFPNVLHTAYFDRSGILWLCPRNNGLYKVTFNRNNFFVFGNDNKGNEIEDNTRALYEDLNGRLWMASKSSNRINIYDIETQDSSNIVNFKKLGCLSPDGRIVNDARWKSSIYCIYRDNDKNMWLGSKGDGLFKFIPQNNEGNIFKVEHFTDSKQNGHYISNNNVYSVIQDSKRRIWIGTYGGGVEMSTDGKKFTDMTNVMRNCVNKECEKIRCLAEDTHGNIYIGSTNGLWIARDGNSTSSELIFRHYVREAGNPNSLGNNDIIDISITRKGDIYIGTFGGGISKVETFGDDGFPVLFHTYTSQDGLPSDLTLAIAEDTEGKLWISSQNELSRFDPANGNFEFFPEVKKILEENSFSEATKCLSKTGLMMIGCTSGVMCFKPANIHTGHNSPYLALTSLSLFNKKAEVAEGSPLTSAIDNCNSITLNHNQNYFGIEYAALDYENPQAINYAYMLENLDKDWNFVGKQHTANYTNIPNGEYLFRVKSTNSEGVWGDNERVLKIIVKPPFWKTPLAYILYLITSFILIFIVGYNLFTIYRLKMDVRMEKKISDMKLKFFTDISHEIRTPLTLIASPVEYLMNDARTPETVKKQLGFISQNTNRMASLVNQILDFRKMQSVKLRLSEINLAAFVKDVFNIFVETAEEKNIKFTFNDTSKGATIWADRDCLEKIVMNLLSNAFKHASSGKAIDVLVTTEGNGVTFKVRDKGPGITKDQMKKIFVRFASFGGDSGNPSTGIGLSLVKELADRHSAKVHVDSEIGKGSCFGVTFLKGTSHFGDDVEYIGQHDPNITENEDNTTAEQETPIDKLLDKRSCVLIVEDDPELRSFLRSILENEYCIIEAEDGEIGLETAKKQNPDFIISDVMMPRMDGINLLKHLRNDVETSHIPIVMLSAKTDIDSQLKGLDYGADDYITKPFSVAYLKSRIANLLSQRKRLQEIFGSSEIKSNAEYNPKPFLITARDEDLMQKVMDIIEEKIDDGTFTIDDMATRIGVSRSTLYNKIKSLTGQPPLEFFRDMRIKRAAQMLRDSQLLVKEIAYMTGFSDVKYFSKCFKSKYGATPLEYRIHKE